MIELETCVKGMRKFTHDTILKLLKLFLSIHRLHFGLSPSQNFVLHVVRNTVILGC